MKNIIIIFALIMTFSAVEAQTSNMLTLLDGEANQPFIHSKYTLEEEALCGNSDFKLSDEKVQGILKDIFATVDCTKIKTIRLFEIFDGQDKLIPKIDSISHTGGLKEIANVKFDKKVSDVLTTSPKDTVYHLSSNGVLVNIVSYAENADGNRWINPQIGINKGEYYYVAIFFKGSVSGVQMQQFLDKIQKAI